MNRKDFLTKLGAGAAGMAALSSMPAKLHAMTQGRRWNSRDYTWISNHTDDDDEARRRLERIKRAGLNGILPSGNYEYWARMAGEFDLDVHAWFITLQRGSDNYLIENHPELFMVNRNGDSSIDKPAYVGYYKWLCPTRPEAKEYLMNRIDDIMEIPEIKSIHLDYIRYPDVILPIQLQPTYDIVQDREYPEYDYCYCDACRSKFRDLHGEDPMDLEKPEDHEIWNRFRYNQVTHLVNQIAVSVRNRGKKVTAAVFPTPDIARSLVRQNWPDWNLDAFFPMIYNHFYHKPVSWVGNAVAECRREMPATTALYCGLYVPEMTAIEVSQAYEYAMENGAAGITIFPDHTMSEEHWNYLSMTMVKG
ncbi:MAG: family 10 glycosylhydrolase [Balneolaceae bacterium]|nr:family 10 glycosylhydrolase [Balneolaceae bacterium]